MRVLAEIVEGQLQDPCLVKTPEFALFDLNALVPNLSGAYQEGIAAAFRMFDEELEEHLQNLTLGLGYMNGVRAVYTAHFSNPWPDEQRLYDLGEAFRKVVKRFVQFSSSLNSAPHLLSTVQSLRSQGIKVGLCSDLDEETLHALSKRLNWNRDLLFDTWVTSDGWVNKTDMISEIMKRFNVLDGRTGFMLGAVPSDIAAGRLCGVQQGLLMASPDHSVEVEGVEMLYSLSQLPEWLKSRQSAAV